MKKVLAGLTLLFNVNAMSASWQITFPQPLETTSTIDEYPIQVLALALDQTGVKYQLKPSENLLSKAKALGRLQDNREINIVWGMTNTQREKDLLPIRIPIFKGLIGWRLLLIRQDMAERFKYIQELEHLVKLSPLQGRDWPDTKILQSNGFDVITERSQSALMRMLRNAQGDFFPRSIIEVWEELAKSKPQPAIQIQPTLGIRYPAAIYFFVNKNSVPLASLIEKGLEKAIKNGKFDALFIEHYKSYIDKAQIENRTFYTLKNTFLPEKTPLERKELWFDGSISAAALP
ncbi:amino acid ABC transporter substrate-binding protein [uncultured Paraglaciecola sp.]|uniref:amino acid ABC transporter substrate-binding protein n=1 Tax=uncultured Paraglaciecola sp. TaxID=1765024 RepID=UPI0030D99677|tara:strand:+ start:1878 stop:2747 length:870 start_codon:yes stop_codon:yes gene_type:complete